MYTETISPKVMKMFDELRAKSDDIILNTNSPKEAVDKIAKLVSSETATRSKTILSDMLFELSDELMRTSFFTNISRQNKFTEINLRHEILRKYQFSSNAVVDYKEAVRIIQALKLGGAILVIGGIGDISVALNKGLSLSSVPIPISTIVITALVAGLTDYFAIEPNKNKRNFKRAVDKYLAQTQQQFLNWFDEIENYFNKRVDEIKQIIGES